MTGLLSRIRLFHTVDRHNGDDNAAARSKKAQEDHQKQLSQVAERQSASMSNERQERESHWNRILTWLLIIHQQQEQKYQAYVANQFDALQSEVNLMSERFRKSINTLQQDEKSVKVSTVGGVIVVARKVLDSLLEHKPQLLEGLEPAYT